MPPNSRAKSTEPACLWERDCLRKTCMPDLARSMRCKPTDALMCRPCLDRFGVANASERNRRYEEAS